MKKIHILVIILLSFTSISRTIFAQDSVFITASIPYNGESATGYYGIYYGVGNAVIDKPIIVVDGFDPTNIRYIKAIYDLFNPDKSLKFGERVQTAGYDIIILNYSDGGDYIQKNAFLLVELIQEINSQLQQNGSNEQLVVAGPSMGGLVIRYALTYMESQGMTHNTRLAISYDSPEKGANAPLGVQHLIAASIFPPISPAPFIALSALNSPAAKQMLIYHYSQTDGNPGIPYPHPLKQALEFELIGLNGNGYPQECKKIAIANGNKTLISQEAFNSTSTIPGMVALTYDDASGAGSFSGHISFMPANPPLAVGSSVLIFSQQSILGYPYRAIKTDFSMPVDNAPGGYKDFIGFIGQGLLSAGADVDIFAPNSCFVPTISALGLVIGYDFTLNIAKDDNILCKTYFDAFYAPFEDNQPHVDLPTVTANWLFDQITMENNTWVIDNVGGNDFSFNFGRNTNNIIFNNVLIENNGKLKINANQNTDYYIRNASATPPQNQDPPVTGSTFEVSTAGTNCKGYQINIQVQSGGEIIIGDNSVNNIGILRIRAGNNLTIEDNGTVIVEPNSKLIFEAGSVFKISNNGTFIVKDNAEVIIPSGVTFILGDAEIQLKGPNAKIDIQAGATVNLYPLNSGENYTITSGGNWQGGELTIPSGNLVMHSGSKLIVQNCKVTFGASSTIQCAVNTEFDLRGQYADVIFPGTCTFSPLNSGEKILFTKDGFTQGGKISFYSGSMIINSGGVLKSDGCTVSFGGSFYYSENAQIQLFGNTASLGLSGDITIANNANFTFTGDGYIKISHTYDRINAGSNSSMTFTGSTKNDWVLEVNGSVFADGLSLFEVQNGTIAGSGYLNAPCPFTLLNANVFSPTIKLYGQPQVTIDNCTFQAGAPSVYALLYAGGNQLTITNSEFIGCATGIHSFGKRIKLNGCTFTDVYNPWIGEGLQGQSNIINCYFDNPSQAGTGRGLELYGASGSKVFLSSTTIKNFEYGIYADGNIEAQLLCSSVKDNTVSGIYLANSASVNMSGFLRAGNNNLSNNATTIELDNARALYLNGGYNNLARSTTYACYKGVGNCYAVQGTLQSAGMPPMDNGLPVINTCNDLDVSAYHNKWKASLAPPTNIDNSVLKECWHCGYFGFLGSYKCTTNTANVNLLDPQPSNQGVACAVTVPVGNDAAYKKDPLTNCPPCNILNTASFSIVKMNIAVQQALGKMELNDPVNGNDLTAIDMFYEILTYPINNPDPREKYLKNLSYENIHQAFANALANGKIPYNDLADSYVQKVFAIQDTLIQKANQRGNTKSEFNMQLEKAMLYRLIEERAKALEVMGNLSFCSALDSNEMNYLNRWNKTTYTELLVLSGEVPQEKFDSLLALPFTTLVSLTGISAQGRDNTNDTLYVCAGDTLAFRPSRFANSYYWSFGNGQTSTNATPSTVYTANGSYTVTLISTFNCGADTSAFTVWVGPPAASFTVSTQSGPAPLNLTFVNNTIPSLWGAGGNSVKWNFGDGNTSTEINPSHTYTEEGNYTACLLASNTCGSDTFCLDISVGTKYQATIGGPGYDVNPFCIPMPDGSIVIAGATNSFGAGGTDLTLMRLDKDLNPVFSSTYGGTNNDATAGQVSVQQVTAFSRAMDGGFIVAGSSNSFGNGSYDIYLVRTDGAGAHLWSKIYSNGQRINATNIVQSADTGFIIYGYTYSLLGGYDLFLLKTYPDGTMRWSRRIAGSGIDFGLALQENADQSIIIGGSTGSSGTPTYDAFLGKLDPSGNTLWFRAYSTSVGADGFLNIIVMEDGYLAAGYTEFTGHSDGWLVKTDFNGNLIWSKVYSGSAVDNFQYASPTSDKGFVLTGRTESAGFGYYDIWLTKTDSLGNPQFSKVYGGTDNERASAVFQLKNRGYLICGSTASFGQGNDDFYLIKTDQNGISGCNEAVFTPGVYNVTPNVISFSPSVTSMASESVPLTISGTAPYSISALCPQPLAKKGNSGEEDNREIGNSNTVLTEPNITPETISSKPKTANPEPQTPNVFVYPNPSTGELNIVYSLSGNEKAEFTVYDLIGKKLVKYELPGDKTVYTISDLKLENGIYFYDISNEKKRMTTGKIVLIK